MKDFDLDHWNPLKIKRHYLVESHPVQLDIFFFTAVIILTMEAISDSEQMHHQPNGFPGASHKPNFSGVWRHVRSDNLDAFLKESGKWMWMEVNNVAHTFSVFFHLPSC